MEAVEAELAALRAQVEGLRRELDVALERLDLPASYSPTREVEPYANMVFSQVSVRHDKKTIPIIMHSDEGESGVSFFDGQRRLRLWLGVGTDGEAGLELYNAEGKTVVSLGERSAGGAGGEVRVNGADGRTRVGLQVSETGGAVSVVDAHGKPLVAMMESEDGAKFFLLTPLQRDAVVLQTTPQGGLLRLYEPGGEAMAALAVTEQGALLNLNGEQGASAVILSGVGALGGSVVFSSPDGETTAMLP